MSKIGTWKGCASRKHVVFKVYSYSSGKPDEVMLYGTSDYVYDDASTGKLFWAARAHMKRSNDGDILIDAYDVFPVSRTDFA